MAIMCSNPPWESLVNFFQVNEFFEFDLSLEDYHHIKILNIFHFEAFVGASWSKYVIYFIHWANKSNQKKRCFATSLIT